MCPESHPLFAKQQASLAIHCLYDAIKEVAIAKLGNCFSSYLQKRNWRPGFVAYYATANCDE